MPTLPDIRYLEPLTYVTVFANSGTKLVKIYRYLAVLCCRIRHRKPFDQEGSIIGGSDRPITVTAKHPGCYTYSVGACTLGTVYGMCGNADTQLIISAN